MKFIITIFFLFISAACFSQAAINNTNALPHNSAALDISNNAKGILFPRLTGSERLSISNPAKGLIVLDTAENVLYTFNGTTWEEISYLAWKRSGSGIYTEAAKVGIGTTNPKSPLGFPNLLGEKMVLSSDYVESLAIGIQPYQLRIHAGYIGDDIAFGTGNSNAFNEKIRIKGTGVIGIGTSVPAPSAILDVHSNDKGILIPRMTMSERNSISSPATGLLIYQTTDEMGVYVNNGSPGVPQWRLIPGALPPQPVIITQSGMGSLPTTGSGNFIGPRVTVTITQSGQKVFISAQQALGNNGATGASGLDLAISYNSYIELEPAIWGVTTEPNQRQLVSLSKIFWLTPGIYSFGMVGRVTGTNNWNWVEKGYITAIVFQ